MEKLLDLLNEFKEGKGFKFTRYDEQYWMFDTNLNMDGNTSLPEETITCKKFWFIKWLVDNDKLNLNDSSKWDRFIAFTLEEYLLMILAIDDSPIYVLNSFLK